jgi:hypothetical protein
MLSSYTNGGRAVNPVITGASLAQKVHHLLAPDRACMAADIIDGLVTIQGLTVKAVAALCGVSAAYTHVALRLSPEQRDQVRAGVPLIQAKAKPMQLDLPLGLPEAVEPEATNDDTVLAALMAKVGVERAFEIAAQIEAGA